MNEILEKKQLNPTVKLMVINSPLMAKKAKPGQFVIVRVDEKGERIPLTIADYDNEKGTVTIIFQEVGMSTKKLGRLDVGDKLHDFVGPLGTPVEFSKDTKRVLAIGGGVGVAPLYPKVKMLNKNGVSIDSIIGGRSAEYVILEDEMRAVSDNLYITTDDGSKGRKGFVTDVLKELIEKGNKYDEVIAIGPLIMMKMVCRITKEYNIPTMVSMNPIMIDGTGMCGGCRVTVDGETKFACVDGPAFDGFKVDFDEAMRRQNMYKDMEKKALEKYEHECKLGGILNG
ncbi:sulfide/dihydroorotate dehydrogenase-like FAD/NAD-binding protein [Thermoanaerobacterium thermosaccharolyticum]|uniref:Oxidoreductase FAD/NAD(P)-binding domain protein n=3 Tax=Thermoanaerobacterium thermosaccharolyticum TaxID=1517 RepID=D9TP57_THETC|nr:sulfide/dihydroorotate dehydrogenase-like FAD/NAD-binding protein [Thermoanaerobacterium thermosaccharolyticum]ADL68676.1 oxidoreductase FAD/NAD(P)-binding domain protein [Thermoanaerobacterium thermosaccharolyticum DSM 571]AGB18761.1 2-polyprenylphenol hydroxylase-like oxidoreductase [Thermoanaerobacterium thermosaccharolyticum M0795]KAA5806731.1 sulfide/dihydroorotate dehydrogenase-like FAD/NAD-binding protein [Thermoanaerobacterium thermosaccharolyticum]OXT06106.1 ferredoxin-NADP reductas